MFTFLLLSFTAFAINLGNAIDIRTQDQYDDSNPDAVKKSNDDGTKTIAINVANDAIDSAISNTSDKKNTAEETSDAPVNSVAKETNPALAPAAVTSTDDDAVTRNTERAESSKSAASDENVRDEENGSEADESTLVREQTNEKKPSEEKPDDKTPKKSEESPEKLDAMAAKLALEASAKRAEAFKDLELCVKDVCLAPWAWQVIGVSTLALVSLLIAWMTREKMEEFKAANPTFKPIEGQVPVPPTQPPPPPTPFNLTQLTQFVEGTPAAFVCAGCKQPITGHVIEAQGIGSFHPECFKCQMCYKVIEGGEYRIGFDGSVHCNTCGLPTCAACGLQITDQVLSAENCSYHPQCFTCDVCGVALGVNFARTSADNYSRKKCPACVDIHQ